MTKRISILLTWLVFSAIPAWAEDVLVFAAASLKEPLDQLAATQPNITVSYGGSGTLARQVLAGAPADVIILAHPIWMDELEKAEKVIAVANILSNRLVLIAPASGQGAGLSLDLTADQVIAQLGGGRLAVGLTLSVPAGIYGAQALQSLGLWSAVQDKLAEVDNVRAVLALVSRGEVPLGLVYATDARVSDDVDIVADIPGDTHDRVVYPAGQLTEKGVAFFNLLQSDEGQQVFQDAGFIPIAGAP